MEPAGLLAPPDAPQALPVLLALRVRALRVRVRVQALRLPPAPPALPAD
ncbi:MAG: hypothetical protein KAY46_27550 [Burkholderiaceae bacterium]|nr:hypothetical protein [Burkholderiaceae bacterium]